MKLVIGKSSNAGLIAFANGEGGKSMRRKWIVNCSPTLEMDAGESAKEWNTVKQILSNLSWKLKISLRVKIATKRSSASASIFVEEGKVKKCLRLFSPKLNWPCGEFVVKLGTSSMLIKGGVWSDLSEKRQRFVIRDCEQFRHMVESKYNSVCYLIDFGVRTPRASEVTTRIMETSYHFDCTVRSKDGVVFPCHKDVLIGISTDLRRQIEEGATQLNLEISTKGIDAFRNFLYNQDLDELKKSLNPDEIKRFKAMNPNWTGQVGVNKMLEEMYKASKDRQWLWNGIAMLIVHETALSWFRVQTGRSLETVTTLANFDDWLQEILQPWPSNERLFI